MKKSFLVAALISFLTMVSTANAQTDTGLLNVTASVNNSCSIDTTGTIDFGVYDPAAESTSSTGTSLNIICNGTTVAWRIHSTQSVATRIMTETIGNSATLLYTLTNDVNAPLAVTDTTGSATGVGSGVAVINGSIAAGQSPIPGNYSQQIPLTIMF